jgi:hypothetical protein
MDRCRNAEIFRDPFRSEAAERIVMLLSSAGTRAKCKAKRKLTRSLEGDVSGAGGTYPAITQPFQELCALLEIKHTRGTAGTYPRRSSYLRLRSRWS